MNRTIVTARSIAIACLAGIAIGQLLCGSVYCRDAIGVLFERGHLLAIVHGRGIYEADVERALEELRYVNNDKFVDVDNEDARRAMLSREIADTQVEYLAREEAISEANVNRECDLVKFQFRDPNTWQSELVANHLSRAGLRREIATNLRASKWIERRLSEATKVIETECAEYFNAHQPHYTQPARYRANHLFLAAPTETPPPIVDLKSRTIDSLSLRISHGENFSELVALTSEDEFTKTRGGDLAFFSDGRMPPDFFEVATKMKVGEISPPIRTTLGFHIIQLTDVRPARLMTFEEAKPEIQLKLENEKRRAETKRLAAELSSQAQLATNR